MFFFFRYTYGENVIGSLQVILGVLDAGGNAERFSTSFHTVNFSLYHKFLIAFLQ